jgi:predicted dehydrogenase
MSARIGVIGAGKAGERQADGFARQSDARIVGIADIDEARAARLAANFGAAAVTDWRELSGLGLDVLVVATPHAFHVAPAEMAAAKGVHLMLEKPLATTLADAQRIVDVSREAGIRLSVSFVHRFREEVRLAKEWLAGAGPLQIGRETQASRRLASDPGWLTDPAVAGGGVLMYSAIHGVDRLRWFWEDEVVEVDARTRRYSEDNDGVEDGIAMLLTFAGGGSATLTANAPIYQVAPSVWETEVHGSKAMVRVRTRGFAETASAAGVERYDAGMDEETARPHYNFERQAADMLAAIASGREPSVTGEDGLRALEICLAAYRSAETGRPCTIDEVRQCP